ncbi:hypothetical protein M1D30_02365 [Prevotella sp. E15-22]|uniref:hypothetical protein n=1 Tax=Prevotella sp. E15-22 TaxID=2937774 RepID=UPI0020522C2E|nr:hypothetical protein [Prevotella sp. E15-22]UPS45029.1 hypothetical protein M1D30_02365 [Prevotella sp. E15-22]
MQAIYKQELASKAGVSVKTLKNWCRPFRRELANMGVKPTAKKLPPHAVQWLSEKLCIDL